MTDDCELCQIIKNNTFKYKNSALVIYKNPDNQLPMIITTEHTAVLSLNDLTHILKVTYEIFGGFVSLRQGKDCQYHWNMYILKSHERDLEI